ncbi:HPr family phosphocarrier protein [Pseudarthrobacter raffinosi]|uniref:HPr family phosphocarrier protein n=1 Tax=Pseudarthrobacter raffinosi TaxID=2953651 RepID=UPI0027E2483B|nr:MULTISPECIES: HPr family phosphocarrier protein [unclassified Pseudarthrobacter]
MFVRAVTETGLPVTIRKAGIQGVDARSLLEVMTADFPVGCEVELSVPEGALSGPASHRDAEDALRMLAEAPGVAGSQLAPPTGHWPVTPRAKSNGQERRRAPPEGGARRRSLRFSAEA